MTKMSYDEAVSFIHGRRKFTKDPSLVKMRRMAELMGNPQKKLKLIHVTGTNGKGSVTAYLRELLMSHGYRVGTFTSPFIVRFNERVAINGEMIPDNELVEEVERIKPVIERIDDEFDNDGPKEFEVLTAIMLDYFVKMEVDYAIIEVGIGGTYDSTKSFQSLRRLRWIMQIFWETRSQRWRKTRPGSLRKSARSSSENFQKKRSKSS